MTFDHPKYTNITRICNPMSHLIVHVLYDARVDEPTIEIQLLFEKK